MKVFKLKHIPTGLFYQPSKGSGNFSERGKVYSQRPNDNTLGATRRCKVVYWTVNGRMNRRIKLLNEHFNLGIKKSSTYIHIDTYVKTRKEDWEIVEFECV